MHGEFSSYAIVRAKEKAGLEVSKEELSSAYFASSMKAIDGAATILLDPESSARDVQLAESVIADIEMCNSILERHA